MILLRRLTGLLGAFLVLVLVGCSGSGVDGNYATVSGTIYYNNNPVSEARVQFMSTTKGTGPVQGVFETVTDSSGKYMIANVGDKPGIPPGVYKVVVTKLTGGEQFVDDPALDLEQLELSGSGKNLLPKKYGSSSTTKLSATLKKGENEGVDFKMTDS